MSDIRRVRLTNVQGDQEEFADLIGQEGDLKVMPAEGGPTFFPDGRGDFLTMMAKSVKDDGGSVVVSTKLGNTFTFKVK